jgi:hypothetical protein
MPACAKAEDKSQREAVKQAPDIFQSNEEPQRGTDPLRIDLIEDRYEYLSDRKLVKEEKVVQRYRFSPMKADAIQLLTGLGYGTGNVGCEQPAAHQTDARANAGTETAGCARLAGKLGDICAGHRIVSGTPSAMRGEIHRRRRREHGFSGTYFGKLPDLQSTQGEECHLGLDQKRQPPTTRGHRRGPLRRQDCLRARNRADQSGTRHSLALARNDLQKIGADEWQAFLLLCAIRRGWVPQDQMSGYQRRTTTHREAGWHFCIGIANLEED